MGLDAEKSPMRTVEMLPPTTGPKSVKKVSQATLKRRMRETSSNAVATKDKEQSSRFGTAKSSERKPLFKRMQNANFFKKGDNETEILVDEPRG